jgi:predicted cobalt transporter CbtA
MVRTFLVRGMLVGIVAGLLSFAFLKIYGEPQVDRAVAFETQQDEAKAAAQKAESHNHASASHDHASEAHKHVADHDEPEAVSRSVQAGLGLFVAVLGWPVWSRVRLRLRTGLGRINAAGSVGGISGHWLRCYLSSA